MAAFHEHDTIANRILLALPPASFKQLSRHLEHVDLRRGQVLHRSDEPVRRLYFVNRGMVCLVKTMQDGRTIEVGATGLDGVTTPEVLFGSNAAILDGVVQVPGSAFVIDRAFLRRTLSKNRIFRELLQGYLHLTIERLAQSAACNRLHSLEERCCRWLLIAHDCARADSFPLTHEFLAMMLGAQRPGVSITMKVLQNAGFVQYVRGKITIADRAGLEGMACECFGSVRHQLDKMFSSAGER